MKLSTLLQRLSVDEVHNFQDVSIFHISHDSRKTTLHSVFIAIRGERFDGRRFIDHCDAPVVVVDKLPEKKTSKTVLLVKNLRKTMAVLSQEIYHHPSQKLRLIGITGTNGKTTTAWILSHILGSLGQSVGLIGTLGHQLNGKALANQDGHTTPESPEINRMLQTFVSQDCTACVMEVSSIGISMYRSYGLAFDVVAFTNFTQDHLDFHGTMDAYFQAKENFITNYPSEETTVILNQDQPKIASIPVERGHRQSFGQTELSDWRLIDRDLRQDGISFSFGFRDRIYQAELPLVGAHNIENALVAIAAAHGLGFSIPDTLSALSTIPQAPGRLERIASPCGWNAFVDYAHTPDALEKSLRTLRELGPNRLVVVFGCGGDRDRKKRPLMGEIAERLADTLIITSDNPRSEDPELIISEIKSGCQGTVRTEVDRRTAILEAIHLLDTDDILLVAGKGHETYQIIGNKTIHFDDRDVIREQI